MSLRESQAGRSRGPSPTRDAMTAGPASLQPMCSEPTARRIRHQALDKLAAASLSLGGSIATTLMIAAVLRWLM
jgi:hypothetical protein